MTLRSKFDRKSEADTNKRNPKKIRGMFGFSNTAESGVAVVSDEEAEEFAMLSMHEATISQARGSTYLSALNKDRRGEAAVQKKSASPIQYAGPICRQSVDRKGALSENDGL